MVFRIVLLASMVFLMAGCVGAVKLRHPTTKEEVTCGPYALKFGIGHQELERCLDDYQRQGYVRVPD